MRPTTEQAKQFALILSSGAPAREAIRYFLPPDSGEALSQLAIDQLASRWLADPEVEKQVNLLQGGEWSSMTATQRIQTAIDKHYVEMAYFLFSRNYVELTGPEKSKADTCRVALEAKLAGTSGKLSAVEQFWSDVTSGRIKLGLGASPTTVNSTGLSQRAEAGAEPPGRSEFN